MNFRIAFLVFITAVNCPLQLSGQKIFTKKVFKDWQDKFPNEESEIAYTVWLVGDLGVETEVPIPGGLKLLLDQTQKANKNSAVVFLGNQVSAQLPMEQEKDLLLQRLKGFKDFEGKVYLISGNKEWEMNGKEGLEDIQKAVKDLLGKKGNWFPKAGCGKPKVVELNDWITLLLLDSQWYYNLEYPITNQKGCPVDDKVEFQTELEKVLDEYDNTDLLIATHHPYMSGGPYAGYSSWKDHFLPPVAGSIVAGLKTIGLDEQYRVHPKQQEYADLVLAKTAQLGHIIFASSHDLGLQYTKEVPGFTITGVVKSDRHFIVSGGLSKGGYIRKLSESDFGYQGQGFSKLLYLDNGEIWMEMWGVEGENGRLLFRQQVKEKDLLVNKNPQALSNYPDSITYAADSFYAAGESQRKFMGTMYRDAWITPVKLPVLDLATKLGGLTPIKKGGGIQSKSLRMVDKKGQQYVIRSVKKDVSLLIPKEANQTFLQDLVQDALSMSHPYGARVVAPLAEAAGVYHTEPEYYYVPKQPALGDFNTLFGDQFYLFEKRPEEPDEGSSGENFGNAENITSTPNMLDKIWSDPKDQVDPESFLRARLFDNLIGDWDRHEDQWRWAEFDQDTVTFYRPIPRDRDQVFLTIDGFLPWIVSREWGARMFQSYGEDIRDLQGQNLNARYIDRLLLSGLPRETWIRVAKELQQNLTDEVLEKAFDLWPSEIFDLNGEDIMQKFKARRARFPEIAERYYKILAKEVNIVGTHEKDRFVVERFNNNQTRIRLYSREDKDDPELLKLDRTFLGDETREIRLYGLKGKDTFDIKGMVSDGILLRIIGGPGEDAIEDQSVVSGKKKTFVYDLIEDTQLNAGPSTKDKRENSLDVNNYVYKSFKPNSYLPLIYPGFNVDDGLTLGGSIQFINHGFRKDPFKSKHVIGGNIAFTTGSFLLNYTADVTDILGKWDFHFDSHVSAPRFVVNFFGLGNETLYTDEFDDEFDFNRIRIRQLQVYPALRRTFNKGIHTLTMGPIFQSSKVEETADRFVSSEASGLDSEDFENKNYGGVQLGYELDARDNTIAPKRGYHFSIQSGVNVNMGDSDKSFTKLKTELALYHLLKTKFPIVIASRVGFDGNFGEYEFFQAATLGRNNNLRGFRRERFSGDQAFYHNTELRLPFARTKNYFLPIQFGLMGFFDYGRVWLDGEDSDRWHQGYGGGIILSPFSSGVFTLTYEKSEEFDIIGFRLGFLF